MPPHTYPGLILQVLLFGRDDGYRKDYVQRTSACLNFNLRAIYNASLQGLVEIVFADCGYDNSLTRRLAISDSYSESLRFLHVPIGDGKQSGHFQSLPTSYIQNITLVHATAPFILWGSSDQVGSVTSFKNLVAYLEEAVAQPGLKKFLVVQRSSLHRSFFNLRRSFTEVDYYLENLSSYPEAVSGAGGHAAFIGGFRDDLLELGGLANSDSWGGNDIDLFIRSSKTYGVHNLTQLSGVCFYKLPNSRSDQRNSVVSSKSMSWVNSVGRVASLRFHSDDFPVKSFMRPLLIKEVSHFPILSSVDDYDERSWLFYSGTRVSLPSYVSFVRAAVINRIIRRIRSKSVVIDGLFTHHFVRTIFFLCPSCTVFLLFDDTTASAVVSAMHTSRTFLSMSGSTQGFSGDIYAIRKEDASFSKEDTLNYLAGSSVLFLRQSDTCVSYSFTSSMDLGDKDRVYEDYHLGLLSHLELIVFYCLNTSRFCLLWLLRRITALVA